MTRKTKETFLDDRVGVIVKKRLREALMLHVG